MAQGTSAPNSLNDESRVPPLPHPAPMAPSTTIADDSDPDFDDLDDVLDQFSANVQLKRESNGQPPHPTPSVSGPGRCQASSETTFTTDPRPLNPTNEESEEVFVARLTSEMTAALGDLNPDPSGSTASAEDISKMGKELEDFTSAMEKQGVKPEDILNAMLGGAAGVGGDQAGKAQRPAQSSRTTSSTATDPATVQTSGTRSADSSGGDDAVEPNPPASFESSIRRTMERMQASDSDAAAAATTATATNGNSSSSAPEEDMLATLLKAMESSSSTTNNNTSSSKAEDQDENSLNSLFLTMMQQLTTKDMLYEPMKELDTQFPAWLSRQGKKQQNQQDPPSTSSSSSSPSPSPSHPPSGLSASDHDRYDRQRRVVADIVAVFERPGYSDEDPSCRALVWDKMQVMQGLGSPPEELIGTPFPGLMGGGGMNDGQGQGQGQGQNQGQGGLDPGCPTQ